MSDILALDIETSNYSWEIGGWGNLSLFEPTVVATWDGENGNIFSKEDTVSVENMKVHDLHPQILGDFLQEHIEKGGKILGHNIVSFDLPVIRDALDCWAAGDVLGKSEQILDTKILFRKASFPYGKLLSSLSELAKHNLGQEKLMESTDAPIAWREGRYDEVAEYCLKDAQLTYDLYMMGRENCMLKSRCRETGDIKEVELEW
jgi:DEAD/DEAH box helicase domain-containing protein